MQVDVWLRCHNFGRDITSQSHSTADLLGAGIDYQLKLPSTIYLNVSVYGGFGNENGQNILKLGDRNTHRHTLTQLFSLSFLPLKDGSTVSYYL